MNERLIPTTTAHYTAQQIAQMYGYSVSSLKSNFTRTAASIKQKFGVDITKCKDINGVYYRIEIPRALTIYEELKDEVYVPLETIKMDDLAAYIVIAVAAMPQGVFRGTAKQFLDYIGLSHNKRNIELFYEAIKNFINNEESSPVKCEKDEKSVIIYIKDNVEEALILTISMLRECRRIIAENNKQDIKVIQLLKVWQAYRLSYYNGVNPLTDKDIAAYTGLTTYQIGKNKQLLKNNNIIKLDKKNTATYCLGTEFELNGIIDKAQIILKPDVQDD